MRHCHIIPELVWAQTLAFLLLLFIMSLQDVSAFFGEGVSMFWTWATSLQTRTENVEEEIVSLRVSKAFNDLIKL